MWNEEMKNLRVSRNWDLYDLARESRIKYATLYNYERGTRIPADWESLKKIASALGQDDSVVNRWIEEIKTERESKRGETPKHTMIVSSIFLDHPTLVEALIELRKAEGFIRSDFKLGIDRAVKTVLGLASNITLPKQAWIAIIRGDS